MEQEEIKQDFLESLEELTFNSRPIIQMLTTIAQENALYASAVVDAVEHHLLSCPPSQKLPALYLVDSICKNVRVPYVDLFTSRVYRLFSDTFKASPDPVRAKLADLFKTWTTGFDGQPLFTREVLRQLESFLQQARGGSTEKQRGPVNQTTLLVEVNRTIKQAQALEQSREADNILGVLTRLQNAMATPGVDPGIFPNIQRQVEEYRAKIDHLSRNPPRRKGPMRNKRKDEGSGAGAGTDANRVPLGTRKIDFDKLAQITAPKNGSSSPSLPSKPANSSDIPSLLDSLQKSGIVTLESVELTTADLAKPRPNMVAKLYAGLPCSTCGMRFPDTADGQQAKEREADWHFRVNKELREGRSRNRLWYVELSKWIEHNEEEDPADAPAEAINSIDLEAEAKKVVPAPADDTEAVCPVCQDKFVAVYSEEAEEWVWTNAVQVEGHYFNATCFADPNNQAVVAAILENDLT